MGDDLAVMITQVVIMLVGDKSERAEEAGVLIEIVVIPPGISSTRAPPESAMYTV